MLVPAGEVIQDTITSDATYTVSAGDTLYSIAREYNTTIDEIKILNNLSTNILYVGQKLKVPMTTITTTYIVEKGDTLYSIADKFNTTVDKIKSLNNLNSNFLKIGQELIVK